MFLFTLSKNNPVHAEDKLEQDASTALFKRVKRDHKDAKKDFNEDNCFAGMTAEDFKKIMFLAHSDGAGLENFTVKEFVKHFVKNFKKLNLDKSVVRDIYIIACEAGKKDAKGKTLAQAIAEGLYNEGFTNVMVRAVAQPDNVPELGGMRVRVIARPSKLVVALKGLPEEGDIEAFYLTKQQEAQIQGNEKEIKNLKEQLKEKRDDKSSIRRKITQLELQNKDITEHPQQKYFHAKGKNLIEDLDRKLGYYFHPKSARKAEAFVPKMSDAQVKALEVIQAKIKRKEEKLNKPINLLNKKKRKHDAEVVRKLNKLKEKLQQPDSQWLEHVKAALRDDFKENKLKKNVPSVFKSKANSTTRSILKQIIAENEQVQRHQPIVPLEKFSDERPVISAVSSIKITKRKKNPATEQVGAIELEPLLPKRLEDNKQTVVNKLREYAEQLKAGADAHEQKLIWGLTLLWPGMKRYKSERLFALAVRIEDCENEWKPFVEEAKKDRLLVAGFSTHNTRNLLNNVLNDDPNNYIEEPAFNITAPRKML